MTALADQTAIAPMSDKDQKALERCKAMTEAQRAQSSKCTTLMKQSGDEPKKNELMRESALHH